MDETNQKTQPTDDRSVGNVNASTAESPQSAENLLVSLLLNLLVPSLLLMNGTKWFGLDPTSNLVIALAFPVAYFLWDLVQRRKASFLAILGFISIFTKGSIGFFELNKGWVAVNEAVIPLMFGLAIVLTLKTKKPLVRVLLYNPQVVDVDKVDAELDQRGNRKEFDSLLTVCTWLLASSFLLSAVLNVVLALIIIQTEPSVDKEVFNSELGRMQLWSYPVIVLPSMVVTGYALYKLITGIKKLTGLEMEQVMKGAQEDPKPASDAK